MNCIICNKLFSYRVRPERLPLVRKFCSKECAFKGQSDPEKIFNSAKKYYENHIIKHSDDLCWEWIGRKNKKGYGEATYHHNRIMAHRLSWIIHNGPIPDKKWILHKCDNPQCTNPVHLFLGDCLINNRDMKAKDRYNSPKGSDCYKAKLTEEQVIKIKYLLLNKELNHSQIAKIFNVHSTTIYSIDKKKNWKHIE